MLDSIIKAAVVTVWFIIFFTCEVKAAQQEDALCKSAEHCESQFEGNECLKGLLPFWISYNTLEDKDGVSSSQGLFFVIIILSEISDLVVIFIQVISFQFVTYFLSYTKVLVPYTLKYFLQPNSDSLHSIDIFLPHEKCVVLCISLKSSFYTIDPEYYRDIFFNGKYYITPLKNSYVLVKRECSWEAVMWWH